MYVNLSKLHKRLSRARELTSEMDLTGFLHISGSNRSTYKQDLSGFLQFLNLSDQLFAPYQLVRLIGDIFKFRAIEDKANDIKRNGNENNNNKSTKIKCSQSERKHQFIECLTIIKVCDPFNPKSIQVVSTLCIDYIERKKPPCYQSNAIDNGWQRPDSVDMNVLRL